MALLLKEYLQCQGEQEVGGGKGYFDLFPYLTMCPFKVYFCAQMKKNWRPFDMPMCPNERRPLGQVWGNIIFRVI